MLIDYFALAQWCFHASALMAGELRVGEGRRQEYEERLSHTLWDSLSIIEGMLRRG